MVKRIHILVEGPTEETFVDRLIIPHLSRFHIYADATIVCTKRVQGRRAYRGGGNDYQKMRNDLQILLRNDTSATAVTTIFDYYGLPGDFPGYHTRPTMDPFSKVAYLEEQMYLDINHTKFIPNLILHEFEALLFSDHEIIAETLEISRRQRDKLNTIINSVSSPEEINNSPDTAPSKRLEQIIPGYQKQFHCSIIAPKIGLGKMREKCTHFNNWMNKLESL
ncbi:MAG: hypothetical protein CVU90_13880 [Firmicutes bacterium HGW-Firmicutes-15]|nr:MAG: hypothetical protein CVU90_13880 [Firmicutes bacterium HGW-Firmicutes-15]